MYCLDVLRWSVILAMLTVASPTSRAQDESVALYQRHIESISSSFYLDLDIPGSLFGFPEFREVWEQPKRFKMAAIGYVTNEGNPERNREVAAYAAHSLPIDDYLDLCEALLAAYKDGRVSLSMLEESVLPALNFNTKIAENFEQERVRAILQEVRKEFAKLDKTDRVRYVDSIMAGEAATDVAQMRCLGQLPDREAGTSLFCVTYLTKRIAGNLWRELTRRILSKER